MTDVARIKTSRLPVHIGIIMDGNGRWAKKRNQPRTFGHNEGLKAAKRIVRAAAEIGIKYLSLYTFSTENWKRAQKEVSFLMHLIKLHLRRELAFYQKNQIKVIVSGDISGLPASVIKEIRGVEDDTANFERLTVNLAINYGGQDEIVRACNRWLHHAAEKEEPVDSLVLTSKILKEYMDHPELPDIDIVIRTGGEKRLSNFFIWESAYAEFYFSSKLWPDWDKEDLFESILDFQKRERRFGDAR